IDPYTRPANSTPAPFTYGLKIVFDNGDLNGTQLTATNGTLGQTLGNIGADNGRPLADTVPGTASKENFTKDVDWYKFTATGNGVLDFSVSTSSTFTIDLGLLKVVTGIPLRI